MLELPQNRKELVMIDKKLEAAFNEQINKEFYSEYLYLSMKVRFMEWNLQGFVNWFNVQVQEERDQQFKGIRGAKGIFLWVELPAVGMWSFRFRRNSAGSPLVKLS